MIQYHEYWYEEDGLWSHRNVTIAVGTYCVYGMPKVSSAYPLRITEAVINNGVGRNHVAVPHHKSDHESNRNLDNNLHSRRATCTTFVSEHSFLNEP